MTWHDTIQLCFPHTMTDSDYVARSYAMLEKLGFDGPNTIACVSVCRDEITRPLVDKIHATWGEAFNFSRE